MPIPFGGMSVGLIRFDEMTVSSVNVDELRYMTLTLFVQELKYLIGTGVSAAAVWHLREMLDNSGFEKVRIVASSGFGPEKCKVFSLANVPVDVIGTGSYLPSRWSETYATADIISYGGKSQVKLGREFLIRR